VVLVDGAGVEVEDVGHHRHLGPRAGDRLADVPGLDLRKLLGVLLDEPGQPPQQPRAVGHTDGTPARERGAGTRHGLVGRVGVGGLELRDRLLGRGVDDRERHEPCPSR
jgi:hypothetical protein